MDAVISYLIMLVMFLIGLSYWGPIPFASLWVGSQAQYLTGSAGAGILTAFIFVLALLLGGLALMRRLDRAWILVRRAAGHDQRDGILSVMFGVTCVVGAASFAVWLILFSGAELAPVGIRF